MSKPPTSADVDPSSIPSTSAAPEAEQRLGEISPSTPGASPAQSTEASPSTPTVTLAPKLPAEMSSAELVVEVAMILGQIKELFQDDDDSHPVLLNAKALLVEMGARAALQWAVLAGNQPEISLPKSVDQMAAAGDKGLANFKIEQAQAPTRARRQDIRKT